MNENKVKTIGASQVLFHQGEKTGDLYVIQEGEIELSYKNPDTGKSTVIGKIEKMGILGSLSYLLGEPRSATATAKTEVKYIKVFKTSRDKTLTNMPKWQQLLIKDLALNLTKINQSYTNLRHDFELLEKKYKARVARDKD